MPIASNRKPVINKIPMSLKEAFAKIITLWALMGGGLLLVIVAVTAINAAGFSGNFLARLWGGNVPGLSGYEDAVQMFVGVAALAMFPYAQLHRAHAVVDILMQHAPAWLNHCVVVLSNLLIAGIAAWLAYMSILGAQILRADQVETTVLGWQVWVFMSSAVISCTLWAGAALLALFTPPETHHGA